MDTFLNNIKFIKKEIWLIYDIFYVPLFGLKQLN